MSELLREIKKINLFDYQNKVVKKALERDCYALFVDMGLGKTLMALTIAFARKAHNNINRVLIVCPKTLSNNWENEIEEKIRSIFGVYWTIKVNNLAVLESREVPEVANSFDNLKYDIVFDIINFEKLIRIGDTLPKYDMLIVDESTRIKNPKSQRYEAIYKMFREIPYRLILTGSPIVRNVDDIWSQLKIISAVDLDFKTFKKEVKKNKGKWYEYADSNIIAIKKEDIENFKFPKKIYKELRFELSDEAKVLYAQIKERISKEMLVYGKSKILASLIQFQRITSGFNPVTLTPLKENRKINLLVKLIKSGRFEKPFLIWSCFVKDIKYIHSTLEREGFKGAKVFGEIKQEDRMQIIQDFQNYKYDFLVAHPAVLGIGTTLTASNVCIYYANSFRFEDRIQSEDRIHRVVQQKPECYYIDLVARNTIDEIVLENLKNKRSLSNMSVAEIRQLLK